jgi:uncharacterized protein
MTKSVGAIKWSVPSADRPLPNLDEADTAHFWRAAQDHELTYGFCTDCDSVVFYPRAHCTRCLSMNVENRVSAGHGTVYSYTVVRYNPHPAFSVNIPYIVALVDLDEGFRLLTHIKCDPEQVRVDQRVELQWETVEGFEVPVFAPAE